MRKKKILMMLAMLLTAVTGAWAQIPNPNVYDDTWDGVTKTKPSDVQGDWVTIHTAAELAYITEHWGESSSVVEGELCRDLNFSLDANLDMSAANWTPMGAKGVHGYDYFAGKFYGNSHTICIKIDRPDSDDNKIGLFKGIYFGEVRDLHVTGKIEVGDAQKVGGICGTCEAGTIINCWVSADIKSSHYSSFEDAFLGGIAGQITNGNYLDDKSTMQFCCMTGNVENPKNSGVGGLAGVANACNISHCTLYGNVSVDHDQDNKWIGNMSSSCTFENYYDSFNQDEYNAASGNDLYRYAIKYPYAINVTTVGQGSVTVSADGEDDIPGCSPGQTVKLTQTSGMVAHVTITDADGNNVSVTAQNPGTSYTFTMPKKDVTATVYIWADWPTQGAGTAESPYIISGAADWNDFAHNVNLGRSYSGKYVKLTSDISVTTMAGGYQTDDNYQPFSGIFDGDGHTLTLNVSNQGRFAAPFKCVNGATIKNLRTAGTISGGNNADGKLLSGIVGVSFGSTTITNCRSSVTLTTDFGEDAALAGIVAGTKGGNLTIEGCAFDGSMTGASNTRCAGIAGYEYTATTTTITNTLFAPTTLTVSIANDTYTKTFSRDADATITNCYYTRVLGTEQGTHAYAMATAPANLGNLVQDYGMVKAYANGLLFGGMYYADISTSNGDDSWEVVYSRTQTTSANWTALSAGSTTGRTLGSADAMTYYYATGDLSFTNSTAGGSGLKIQGTVYLYIPSGTTLTCTGANADGRTGAGAGIELTAGNSLYLIGGGTVNATGGKAANGGNGGNGNDAEVNVNESYYILGGSGGTGGNGGGGAGAGIGTRGGNGGSGGCGGQRTGSYTDETTQYGVDGNPGTAGGAAGAMGSLYLFQSLAPTMNVNGGRQGSNGSGGNGGRTASQHPSSNVYMASGGGGGGAGGFGGAASDIGTGGPGGGGGGGGAAGNVAWVVYSGTANGYYHAGAYGGDGGKNADGTTAPDGADVELDNPKHADIQGVGLRSSASDYTDDAGWEDGNGRHPGGAGGAAGPASVGSSAINLMPWPTQGKGTEGDPYLISNANEWYSFITNIINGNTFNGKFVTLNTDISVETMAGVWSETASERRVFSGTFDGDGHTLTFNKSGFSEQYLAPFRYVGSATIKNLKTAGTIQTTGQYAGGLIANIVNSSTVTIRNCVSSVTINSTSYTNSGFVSRLGDNSQLTISGCAFVGSLEGSDSRNNAGFVGYCQSNSTATIEDCLFAPSNISTGLANCQTFARGGDDATRTINRCYYTQTYGTDQGTEAVATATAPANLGSLVEDYVMVKAYANGILVGGTYYVAPATVTLADNSDNTAVITDADGYVANVTFAARTLYKDGAWNTICLPFNVTLSGSPLEDAVARPLESASISGSTLNLTFGDAVTTLEAGTPYIIKWTSGDNLVSPVFSGVTIDADADGNYDNGVSGDERVRFLGTYKSTAFDAEDKSILFMGGANTLYYPKSGASIGAQRAYFKIGSDGALLARRLTAFNIDFGDDEATGIISTTNYTNDTNSDAWYSLDGRRLSAKPSRAGVYINKGIKVVIK